MVQKEIKKKTSVYATVAILLATVLVSMVYVFGSSPNLPFTPSLTISGMKTFSSMDALEDYLTTTSDNGLPQIYGGQSTFVTSAPNAERAGAHDANDYSSTNIQVAGVDEADTVKTDGQYIYTLSTAQNSGIYYYDYSLQPAN